MTPRQSLRAAAMVLAGALLATGCASSGNEASDSKAPSTDLEEVSVSGDAGKKPTIKVPAPFSVTKTDIAGAGRGRRAPPSRPASG